MPNTQCSRCSATITPSVINNACHSCHGNTALCTKCCIICSCKSVTCLECFQHNHTNTCFTKRTIPWNAISNWECSCHKQVHLSDFRKRITCDECDKQNLCSRGATDCECGATMCLSCNLNHACDALAEFEKEFLQYKCSFRKTQQTP